MLLLHPQKTSQKLPTPLHITLDISGEEPQCSLTHISQHGIKLCVIPTHKHTLQCKSQELRDKETAASEVNYFGCFRGGGQSVMP